MSKFNVGRNITQMFAAAGDRGAGKKPQPQEGPSSKSQLTTRVKHKEEPSACKPSEPACKRPRLETAAQLPTADSQPSTSCRLADEASRVGDSQQMDASRAGLAQLEAQEDLQGTSGAADITCATTNSQTGLQRRAAEAADDEQALQQTATRQQQAEKQPPDQTAASPLAMGDVAVQQQCAKQPSVGDTAVAAGLQRPAGRGKDGGGKAQEKSAAKAKGSDSLPQTAPQQRSIQSFFKKE